MSVTEGTIIRLVASIVFPDDVIMQNVFHVVLTTLVGAGDEDDIVLDLEPYIDDIYQRIDGNMKSTMVPSELKVYEYDAIDDDFDEVGTGSVDFTPLGTADMMPHGCALVQIYYTLDPDVQGRKFWGGFTEGDHADGDWDSSILANAVLAGADVISSHVGPTTGSTYTPGVWSPTNTNFFAYSGVIATNAVVGYQRRRKPGVGI